MRKSSIECRATELRDQRGKKTGRVQCTLHGLDGYGSTIDEAETAVSDGIRRVSNHTAPDVIYVRGYTAILWAEQDCFYYSVISGPDRSFDPCFPVQQQCHSSSRQTRDESLDEVLSHLARISWEESDGTTVPSWMEVSSREEMKSSYLAWVEFQQRYRVAQSRGLSDDDCHSFAGRNPSKSHLWLGV